MTTETTRSVEITHNTYRGEPIHGVLGTAELRRRLNPFVFLDHFDLSTNDQWGFDWHPHSGVATFTYVLSSDLDHADTGGAGGRVHQGGVQWMAAGGGIWHKEYYQPRPEGRVNGLQLWIALPPELENGPVSYQHAEAVDLPVTGNTRVLAGRYADTTSPISAPVEFNYFDITLADRETWDFDPPPHHDVAWLYTQDGSVTTASTEIPSRTLAVFSATDGPLRVTANRRASFVVGTAPATHHPIVTQGGSMHTSQDALNAGQQRIAELGSELRRN